MRVSYYPGTDSAYIRLSDRDSARAEPVGPETVLDFDAEGNVVGIEIYSGAAGRLDLSRIRLERRPEEGPDVSVTFLGPSFLPGPAEVG